MRRSLLVAFLALGAVSCAATFDAGAALVNGVTIPLDELERAVDASAAQTGQPVPEGEARLAQERQQLASLIRAELMLQEGAARGIEISEERVEQTLDELRAQFPSEAEFLTRIEQVGLTLEGLKRQIRLREIEEEIRTSLSPAITEDELRTVYDTSKDQFVEARVRHILFSIPQGQDGAAQERRARATLVELQAGADFGALARERSDDPGSAQDGGRLPGWTLQTDRNLDPSFAGGVQAATVGEVTDPVRSSFGWHLILVEARRTQPFRAVRDTLREQLKQQGADAQFQVFLTDLVSAADVEVNPRYGDWDPQTGSIVPHRFYTPAEPELDPVPNPGFELPPGP